VCVCVCVCVRALCVVCVYASSHRRASSFACVRVCGTSVLARAAQLDVVVSRRGLFGGQSSAQRGAIR
jgi:hypothetical protein